MFLRSASKILSWKSVALQILLVMILLAASISAGVASDKDKDKDKDIKAKVKEKVKLGEAKLPHIKTKPQAAPSNIKAGSLVDEELQGANLVDPIDLKILVISADGSESDYLAITTFLKQIGIPYDTLIATQKTLTRDMLWDGGVHGYYQGIILTTGNLAYDAGGGNWMSAFDDEEWRTLWEYESIFGIRQVTAYTFPYGPPDNYGLNLIAYTDTASQPLQTNLTAEGERVFPYLNPNNPITIRHAWTYLAKVISDAETTPLITTSDGYAIASVHRYQDGRENLTVTAANSPFLMHSMLTYYGIINWVTKGLFLGERHVNICAQVDDLLIDNDIWDTSALSDMTGLTYRLNRNDFLASVRWQNTLRASNSNFSSFMLEMAFNGEGASGIYRPDDLTPAVINNQRNFNWVNHTYSHENLDSITYRAALSELSKNHDVAKNRLRLTNYSKNTLVQPEVSGLFNPAFLRAANNFGIRYLIADSSQNAWRNPSPNSGFYSTYQPKLLLIPRRPTNLFYNVTTPAEWTSEYNFFYGPQGYWGSVWDHNLSYNEILDKESDVLLSYLLKWDVNPMMFHQTNLRAYDNTNSLLGDLLKTTLNKYERVYRLPVRGLSQNDVGKLMADRMAYDSSGVSASLIPGESITLTTSKEVLVPVTGVVYGYDREVYGGQNISYIKLIPGQSVVVPLPAQP